MPETSELQESLKIAVKRRANLRRMFTNQGKKIEPIFQQPIVEQQEDGIELLRISQQKLLDARPELRELDKEIQNTLVLLGDEDGADKDFEEADTLSDSHSALLRQIDKSLRKTQDSTSTSTAVTNASKQLKHSSLKLPKISLPIFNGDRRKWLSFWDVFRTEVHEVKDISNVTKFNFLKGQLSEEVKKRVEGIMASEDNYNLLVETLQDNYGDKTSIKNAHCVALVTMAKPQHTASALRGFYDSLMSDMRSLATLDLPTARYGDFYVPILLEKLPEKLLTNVLKEYPCANPTIEQLITMIHNEVKRLEQVAYINLNNQSSKAKSLPFNPRGLTNAPTTSKVIVPPGTATALSAAVNPSDQSKTKKFKQFKAPKKVSCRLCGSQHSTFQCELSIEDRMSAVNSKQLCLNCLRSGHATTQCQSQWRCSVCRQLHHTVLHGASTSQSIPPLPTSPNASATTSQSPAVSMHASTVCEHIQHCEPSITPTLSSSGNSLNSENGVNPNETSHSSHSQTNTINPVLLKTAVISVRNGEISQKANVFIDEGSSLSYITTQLAKKLCIKPHCTKTVHINTFGGATSTNTYDVGSVSIITDEGTVTVDTLIKDVIVTPIDRRNWAESLRSPHITKLQLADDFSQDSFPVQVLIGMDSVWQFLKPDVIYGYPTAQASSLGYLLSGKLFPVTETAGESPTVTQCFANSQLYDSHMLNDREWYDFSREKDLEVHNKVADFLRIETLGIEDHSDTSQEDDFLERFQAQVDYRDGTYFVPLPWLDNHPPLPSNLSLAVSRLEQVRKRLLKLDLWKPYADILADQIDKGYVEALPTSEDPWNESNAHYLSHFFVLRPDSETTPLRVVFAANAGHVSLNDCLYTGPCLLKSLNTIVHRFRVNKYAFVADIEKAFMRIKINEEDRNYVRFLWFEDGDPNKPIKVYRYTSVFFGGTSSPFILNSTICHHLSKYKKDQDPFIQFVAHDLEDKLYCDNVLTGTDDEDTAIQYYASSRQIMKDADMNLRQWFTNSPALSAIINKMETGSQRQLSGLLGLIWDPKEDILQFPQKPIVIPLEVQFTKRQVLSSASSTFDPVGFISPVIVPAKAFISSMWDKGFNWDEVLPEDLQQEYNKIASEIEKASQFITARCLDLDKTLPVEMHVFCDACPTTAAGCCIFFVQNDKVKFIASKVKIASSKHARTVPQWELIAMVLGARLGATIKEIFEKDFSSISSHYWTDSTVCLHWLFSHKSFNVFTRNRKTEILKLTDLSSWSHVRSGDNPADILSRGCTSEELQHSSLWERGPPWLTDHSLWPTWSPTGLEGDSTISASAAQAYNQDLVQPDTGSLQNLIDVSRFTSYESLLRTMSYVLRFISKVKQVREKTRSSEQPSPVVKLDIPVPTVSEISHAEVILLRAHQIQHFRREREYLQEKTRPPRKPRLQLVRQFNLKLNQCDLLVAPGRLEHAMLDREAKEPILISKKSQFTTLLVRSVHDRQLHAGVRDTVIALRKRFWLPSARGEVTKILRRCVRCRYHVGVPFRLPPSPALPDFRLNKMKPFSTVGIDFTGHLIVKNGSKTQKCYICLFTCSTTRNVNLEIVNDMSTDQFLQAFRRHCAIYGTPSLILCDNARTFVKGDEEIQKLFKVIEDQKVQHHLAQKRVQVRHIPAKSPHWGGMYERLIGVVKMSIKKVLHRALINLSEMQTLIKEVQVVVNDRPITFVSHDVNDPEPLTPSKLLYGYDVSALPHPIVDPEELDDEDFNDQDQLSKVMKRSSLLFQHFVQRFKNEYFASLRERHAYQSKKRESREQAIKVGDAVLIHDDIVPRSSWKLAIVKRLLRGSDGGVRAADIQTRSGVTNRSIHLLYPLEVSLADPQKHFKETEQQIPQVETLRRSKRIAARPRPQYVESAS